MVRRPLLNGERPGTRKSQGLYFENATRGSFGESKHGSISMFFPGAHQDVNVELMDPKAMGSDILTDPEKTLQKVQSFVLGNAPGGAMGRR